MADTDRLPDDVLAAEQVATSLVGETVAGRYRILRQVARTKMSVVYQAHDELLDRPVALKVALASSMEARMARERIVGARLHDPLFVTVHDGGKLEDGDGRSYIIFEWLGLLDQFRLLAVGATPEKNLSHVGQCPSMRMSTT